jgi:hypothetical protein
MTRLAIAAAVLLLTPPVADAASTRPDTLLRRYEPVAILHPDELFHPESIQGFLRDSELEQRLPDGSWQVSGPPTSPLPTGDPVGCAGTPCWRVNIPSCTPEIGVASLACYALLDAARFEPPRVYGAVLHDRGRIVLEYWYWYLYDFWSGEDPPSDYAWTAHEGDWEMVAVLLDAKQRPVLAAYSEHTCGKRRPWARVPKWRHSTHPVVYVSLGSHANSFSPEPRPIDLTAQCFSPVGAGILSAYLHPPLDRTGPGIAVGPRLRGVRAAPVIHITRTSPAWMSFPGAWGEANYFHFPGHTFAAGPGPAGPRFHAIWRQPVKTALAWPPG